MEADKFQDLQLANQGPRRADGVITVQMQTGSKSRKNHCFGLVGGRKKLMSQIKALRQEMFPLTQGRLSLFVLFSPSTD